MSKDYWHVFHTVVHCNSVNLLYPSDNLLQEMRTRFNNEHVHEALLLLPMSLVNNEHPEQQLLAVAKQYDDIVKPDLFRTELKIWKLHW